MNTGIISRINFILLSILFSMFYWILESIRDVIIFNKGPLIERIFIPDTLSLWMRLLIVFILILFGAYVQSQKVKKEVKQNLILKFFGEIRVLWAGLVFGILYWLLEAIRDVFIFEKGNLFSRIFTPDPIGFWMRVLAVLVIILFSFYIQSVINARKNAELSLKKYKDDLESKVAERTKELNQSNELMQKEIAELKKMQTMEISKKVSILPDMYFKKSNFITKSSLQFIFNRYKMKSDTIKNSKISDLIDPFPPLSK